MSVRSLYRFTLFIAIASMAAANAGAGESEKPEPALPPSAPSSTPDKKTTRGSAKDPAAETPPAKKDSAEVPVHEITVIGTRGRSSSREVPSQVSRISAEEITTRLQSGNNLVDALKETPGIYIQKTAQGQGSPFIRGQTGFRNLLMIDGVRFNNSTFREGPIQYWATIDPLFTDHLDVMRGPGSALYGSDAVGGVVNVITKSTDTWSEDTEVGGSAFYRGATAERSHIGHVEVKGSHKNKVGWIFGGSYKDHDDFVAGGGTGLQEYTGYNEWSLNGKVEYRPIEDHQLTFYVDRTRQNDVPRTHRTVFSKPFEGTARGSDIKREFDQNRLLSYLKYKARNLGPIVQEAEVTFSYQNHMQDRFRKRPNGQTRHEGFEVNTFGAQVHLKSKSPIGRLTYGFDYYHDDVESYNKRFNPASVRIQGPIGDDAFYDLFGAYIQDEVDVLDRYLTILAGGRFEYARADADKVEDPVGGGITTIAEDWTSFVGSLRFTIRPDLKHGDHWRVFFGVQQSLRAPSLHDLTSFETTSVQELPSANLDPEEFTTYELGFRTRYGGFQATASYHYTFIHGQSIRSPTGAFAAGGEPQVIKTNGGKGLLQGVEAALSYTFLEDFKLWGNVTWTEGDLLQIDPNDFRRRRQPLRRIIPVMSHMGLKYQPTGKHWWVELHADVFSDADLLGYGDRSDNRFPDGGTPGFGVFGLRGGVKLLEDRLTISGAIENIANVDYRIHGSGQNMPGTNFILSLKYDW